MPIREKSLDIVIDENTKVLIIGTFPSYKSRQKKYYYANKSRNRFGKIIKSIYPDLYVPNNEKEFLDITKPQLLKEHIGLWDAIESCDLIDPKGSIDKNIISDSIVLNEIDNVVNNTNIVCLCNGAKAYKMLTKNFPNIKSENCESTSCANRNDFAKNFDDLPEFAGKKRSDGNISLYGKIKLNRILK